MPLDERINPRLNWHAVTSETRDALSRPLGRLFALEDTEPIPRPILVFNGGLNMEQNRAVVEAWLEHVETQQNRQPHTVRTYRYTISNYLDWLGATPLECVTPEMVEQFSQRPRQHGRRGAAGTVRREVTVVRTFHQWAHERGYGAAMVKSATAPSVKDRDPQPVADDDWLRLWHSDMAPHDRALLGVMYFIGLRRVEVVSLRPSDVDTDVKQLRFKRKGGSTRAVEYGAIVDALSFVPTKGIGLSAEEWLADFEDETRRRVAACANLWWWDAVGDWENDPVRVNRRVRSLANQANLDPSLVRPHHMRHAAATNLLRAGVPVEFIADQLSHSSVTMTLRYANTSGQLARLVAQRKEQML